MSDERGKWQFSLIVPTSVLRESGDAARKAAFRMLERDLWRVSLMTTRTHRIVWECGPWSPPVEDDRREVLTGLMVLGTLVPHKEYAAIEQARREKHPRGEGAARLHAAHWRLAGESAYKARISAR